MPKRAFALAVLNYTLDDDFIIPWLDSLVAAGYQGVCLHPRDGLQVPYNSRHYWERIDRIIGLARERDMEVWHYDEYPFPSGAAGGMIPEKHVFTHAQTLSFEEIEAVPNAHGVINIGRGALLALLCYRENRNGEPYDWRDVTPDVGSLLDTWAWGEWHNLPYTATTRVRKERHERAVAERFSLAYSPMEPLGEDKLLAIKVLPMPGNKKQAGMPDITLPEVTDLFLETIYSRFSELSKKHSLVNTPVFQDEPTFYSPFPWNHEIEKRLRPLWGAELPLKLAALWKPCTPDWELSRYEYRAACQNAFETNWFARVAAWCHAHGLRMAGHLPGEESIFMHAQLTGDIFKALAHFDVPGYDIISSHLPDDKNRSHATGAKIVQSSAWLEGRKPTMVEVFACHGFHSDLQKQRTTLAWLTAQDMTLTFDHSSYSSAQGVRKYDAPPVSNRYNPLDGARSDLWHWNNWFADLLQEYPFDPETLVLFPADALSRYQAEESAQWQEQTALLETWFHYVCAHSLDCIFVPSHLLSEIEVVAGGFHLRGHVYKNFLVPPVASLHETTWEALDPLRGHPGFVWSLPENMREVTIFGSEHPQGKHHAVHAWQVAYCTEDELVERKGGWFDALITSRVTSLQSIRTLIKSSRRNQQDDSRLLILINPENEPLEVRSSTPLGKVVVQPPNGTVTESCIENGEYVVTIAARDTVIYRQHNETDSEEIPTSTSVMVRPSESAYRFAAPNRHCLKNGIVKLEGYENVSFRPARFSSLWTLPLEYEEKVALFTETHSLAPLSAPLNFEVSFPVMLEETLIDLNVFIDLESLPPQTAVSWNEISLIPETEAMIDVHNTKFPIPAKYLGMGEHHLFLRGVIHNGSEGVMERPILSGHFLASDTEPTVLRIMPEDWQPWKEGDMWPQLGMPEGYGPVEYQMIFELTQEHLSQKWKLILPESIGVAEIKINQKAIGHSAWEPRYLEIPEQVLLVGKNRLDITLHGSWNNVFSMLNRVQNGLSGVPQLKGEAI